MERTPDNRFESVTGFKSDLEHLDLVRPTGRADRLQAPKLWQSQWRRIRVAVLAITFILGVFGLIYILSHVQKGKPRLTPGKWRAR
jgi:hypothetical protein